METRAGTSVLLSLCIVAVAAVALYRPDPPRNPTLSATPATSDAPPPESLVAAEPETELPEPTAGVPLVPPPPAPTARRTVAVAPSGDANRPAPVVKPVSVARTRPASSFTTIGVGETLPAIAARVYGSPDAVDTLFRANRDILNAPDDPLQVGGMLRTP